MQSIPEALESVTMGEAGLPRFEDGTINLQELIRRLAEDVNFGAVAELFEAVPEEAYGWTLMTQSRREEQLHILQERLEKGIIPLAPPAAQSHLQLSCAHFDEPFRKSAGRSSDPDF